MSNTMPSYPIELDLRGKTALVVGLGRVGARKAAGLVEAGARVVGVDPQEGLLVPTGVEHRAEAFRAGHLEGVSLAFAAATPEVNRLVVVEARRLGVWVNAASDPGAGDFAVPAVWRGGPVTLAVSTSGASPALARALRDRAARAIDAGPALAALLLEIRPLVLATVADAEARRRLLEDWGDPRWLDAIALEGPEAVRAAWLAALPRSDTGSVLDAAQVKGRLHEPPDFS
jgi:precorrin-2 dehydrogenase / sirohydrochlorin ferrochelatase